MNIAISRADVLTAIDTHLDDMKQYVGFCQDRKEILFGRVFHNHIANLDGIRQVFSHDWDICQHVDKTKECIGNLVFNGDINNPARLNSEI